MREWTTPAMYIENFELDQHFAAACKHPVRYEEVMIMGCIQSDGHEWDVSSKNPFTSAIDACMVKWDQQSDVLKYKDDWIKDGTLTKDANSWGSGNHAPMLNDVAVTEMFNSL